MRTLVMLLKSRARRRAAEVHPHPLPAAPAHLPPGYTRTLLPHPYAEVHPEPEPASVRTDAPAGPPLSPVLASVESAGGALVHLHPAEYTAPDLTGTPTVHGYAWRCTRCPRTVVGYPAAGFGRCYGDATRHECAPGGGRG